MRVSPSYAERGPFTSAGPPIDVNAVVQIPAVWNRASPASPRLNPGKRKLKVTVLKSGICSTTTETSASLIGRRPFSWWLFLPVVVFFPLFGGILYLIFLLATSRATVFLHQEGSDVHIAGDTWLVQLQESQRAAVIEQRRQIRERGFLAVMWPQLLVFLLMLFLWVQFLRWYF